MKKDWDVIIIGAGPAGLTAGIYSSRARMETLVLDKMGPGGQLALTENIENYPGFKDGVGSFELMQSMSEQAKRFGTVFAVDEVVGISAQGNLKKVVTKKGEFSAWALVVAAGASPQRLGVPGEEKLTGRGVSYCATCDAMFFKDKNVVVVGGGDTAIEEAIFLTKFCKKITVVHRRDRLRATKILQERIFAQKDKVDFCWKSAVKEIVGKNKVEAVRVQNVDTGEVKDIACDGVFVFVGYTPNSSFLKGVLKMDESGYIASDNDMKTSADGIFACGDIRKKSLKQVVTACGEGATAAFCAQRYVEELKGTAYS